MDANAKKSLEKLAEIYNMHAEALAEAKRHADFYVVVPKEDDGKPSPSRFVQTMQGGGYKVTGGYKPYTYILPTAMEVARYMRKHTKFDYTYVKLTDWHKTVMDLLQPYKDMVSA